jgi:hypothetical protein
MVPVSFSLPEVISMVEATDRAIAAIKEAFKGPQDGSKKLRITFERGG